MAQRQGSSPRGVGREEHWLGTHCARSRPWAYEELLVGSELERKRARELGAVLDELDSERAALVRLEAELDEHLSHIENLERRLRELAPPDEAPFPSAVPETRAAPAGASGPGAPARRSYLLCRCEGFQVDAPTGPVGFVEGLRFVSRIDQPDLLEVRGGRFGRQLLLIPSEQVEEVRVAEARVVIRSAPDVGADLLDALVHRVRRAVHVDRAAS